MLVAALGVIGFAAYVKMAPGASHVPEPLRRPAIESPVGNLPSSPRRHSAGPDVKVDSHTDPDLKVPAVQGNDVKLAHSAGKVPDGVKPMVFLANATLESLKIEKAKALGVEIKDRNALVDFNPELEKGYGSTEEGQLIKALQMALGQFPDIDTFQIVIDGKTIDSLGQIDLSEPISVIRPDGTEAKPPSTKPDEDPASRAPN
ncbi:GerMN domain-containing protein [Fimbriimonas ginsengisoli]|uniref:Lipoprotein LpqB, GerMN domain protein n=1 Tax=Fimbriimonas ginsengisoli Gsoil 348 TaxID=661478 RepID=A0A068NUD2_FIMGI|nr:GerMN domain-containing protein [Fimbriimonas ginsengisoli]AIE87036.1 Lipoprotein LpqB, GerMN domain protein [Fimbriimonas ginsengisoli Gsoil 348]